MESFVIVSIWYNKDKFIFNTSSYPFLHNIEYHNNVYNYIVYYFMEEECEIPDIPTIQFFDFKKVFKEYIGLINKENNLGNKIDLMKLILIKECEKINYNYILYMDMDCEVINVDIKKIKNNKRFIEPFFDKSIRSFYKEVLDFNMNFDFYIENYAFLLNKENKKIDEINFQNRKRDDVCWVYKEYVKIVYEYYKTKNYIFPQLLEDLKFENSIEIGFERGDSWKPQNDFNKESYEYHHNKKPVYPRVLRGLYINILDNDIKEVRKKIIILLEETGYKFLEKFQWSNSLQKNVNFYGVLADNWSKNDIKKLDDLHFSKTIVVYP